MPKVKRLNLSMEDLPPFRPPYLLGGSVLAIVGFWQCAIEARRGLGALLLSHYQEPPPELPVRYHEVIGARVRWARGSIVAEPFAMVLDAELPVELGKLHYGLPKRFETGLQVRTTADGGRCESGAALQLDWAAYPAWRQTLGLPLRLGGELALRLFTRTVDIRGIGPPVTCARIALRPQTRPRWVSISQVRLDGCSLRPLVGLFFRHVTTELGAPHACAMEAHG